ncbi:MAG TPA: STAS domain-containing protein [Pseudonocardiaceae bacterium]|nr:STAS domain-containing protein [Pseudonocardiaceae bacterium]
MTMAALEIGTHLSGTTVVVHAVGEVDMSSAPTLRNAVLTACAAVHGPASLVVDLTGVNFFGSSGISVLMEAQQQCQALRVVTSQAALRTLQIAGLAEVLDIRDSLADAAHALASVDSSRAGGDDATHWWG